MSYAGDVTPRAAYAALQEEDAAVLVDVRTEPEWQYVGIPDLSALGKRPILVEWVHYPGGIPNERFLEQLRHAGIGADQPLFFLCRSGVRSRSAAQAATAAGLGPAYNVADGFEGQLDGERHRGVGGWKATGLPWVQG